MMKSEVARKQVLEMRTINIAAHTDAVGKESEAIFNQEFYSELDVVCAALDNVEVRSAEWFDSSTTLSAYNPQLARVSYLFLRLDCTWMQSALKPASRC